MHWMKQNILPVSNVWPVKNGLRYGRKRIFLSGKINGSNFSCRRGYEPAMIKSWSFPEEHETGTAAE